MDINQTEKLSDSAQKFLGRKGIWEYDYLRTIAKANAKPSAYISELSENSEAERRCKCFGNNYGECAGA